MQFGTRLALLPASERKAPNAARWAKPARPAIPVRAPQLTLALRGILAVWIPRQPRPRVSCAGCHCSRKNPDNNNICNNLAGPHCCFFFFRGAGKTGNAVAKYEKKKKKRKRGGPQGIKWRELFEGTDETSIKPNATHSPRDEPWDCQ